MIQEILGKRSNGSRHIIWFQVVYNVGTTVRQIRRFGLSKEMLAGKEQIMFLLKYSSKLQVELALQWVVKNTNSLWVYRRLQKTHRLESYGCSQYLQPLSGEDCLQATHTMTK